MVKKGTKKPRELVKTDRFPAIEKELRKQTKATLIEMMLMIAKEHPVVSRDLEVRLEVEKPVDLLVSDVSSSIDRATDFDERWMNYNFDVDWQAYAEVRKGLLKLVDLGQLEYAKSLALKLMKDGSYQVACSDEGLMTDEINECLRPVIRAVKTAGGEGAARWANEMHIADQVGFICDKELAQLRGKS